MNELQHLHVKLSGTNLIEASAGTGKTYAIACLYLRLLIEKGLSPEQILVVTYTEAATEELRGRIRSRIREALGAFTGQETKDSFLQGLVANAAGNGPEPGVARDRLDLALKSFDLASIFTIHGFCMRALEDNAFESGSLYHTELVTDQADLLQEVADDFWRQHFFADPSPLLGYALRQKLTPHYFVWFLKGMIGNPKLHIVPSVDITRIGHIDCECRRLFEAIRLMWQGRKEELERLIETDNGLSRAKGCYPVGLLTCLFDAMDAFIAADNPYDLFTDFGKFTRSGILKGKKPKGEGLADPFFDLCDELLREVSQRFLALRAELLAFAADRLPLMKRERNVRFFDDLLIDLYDALYGPRGDELAVSLRQKYRAALIDEFQDTDPVQYDIFRKVYADPGCPLFLIGDPKQAIYSFRGADIFAYLKAAGDVAGDRRFTLTGNWRSTPRLLAAFNTVFTNGALPFVFDELSYLPVTPGKTWDAEPLTLHDSDAAPLQVWHVPADEEGRESTVGRANKMIPESVAAEIGRLLQESKQGKARIDDKPLLPEHIAVIVRSHRQAGCIQEALRRFGIPSVMRSDKSIFTTDEAREVCTLLSALADSGNEPKVRAALVTAILGSTGNDIANLLENEELWEERLTRFRDYHQIWLERGFMVMTQALMSREGVRGRLLRWPNGERRLTNLMHCFEILHAAAHERRLGVEGLVTWFGERVSEEEATDEYQIRLETDEKGVKILTVHVSKGLEFPIVFCPFLWGGIRSDEEIVTFHDNFSIVKDFGSDDKDRHKIIAQKESLAENLRLLYVALTRAKFRCYLVAGKIVDQTRRNRPETSPLAYLFHASEETRGATDVVASLAQEVKSLPAQNMVEQLALLASRAADVMAISPMPAAGGGVHYRPVTGNETQLAGRTFTGVISSDWRVSSFTSFAAHDIAAAELPDRDETGGGEAASGPAVVNPEPPEMSFLTFPRGARAGIFLHEIFEKLDFSDQAGGKSGELVAECLKKHGYSDEWQPHLSTMITNVITTALATPEGSFALCDLRQGSWLTEMEFFFPLKFVTSTMLSDYFRKWSGAQRGVDLSALCRAMSFRPAKGMLRGFMDMVFEHHGKFYLVDWKSNHLGYRIEDYGREMLQREMVQKIYPLQYLLYTVALNRYLALRARDYEYTTHFGGIIYFFLRGVSQKRGEEFGIFRDIPPVEMIDDLTTCLIQVGG